MSNETTTPAANAAPKTPAKSPAKKRAKRKPHYQTGDVAAHFKRSPKSMRRVMRAVGIRCGSGARHVWTPAEYRAVIKKCAAKIGKPKS